MPDGIFEEIREECKRRDEKWGEQNYPMLDKRVPVEVIKEGANICRTINESEKKSWFSVLREEFYKTFAETEPKKQREKMIRVAAVAVAIIECLDRRINEKMA